jgi:hypothetical protein
MFNEAYNILSLCLHTDALVSFLVGSMERMWLLCDLNLYLILCVVVLTDRFRFLCSSWMPLMTLWCLQSFCPYRKHLLVSRLYDILLMTIKHPKWSKTSTIMTPSITDLKLQSDSTITQMLGSTSRGPQIENNQLQSSRTVNQLGGSDNQKPTCFHLVVHHPCRLYNCLFH